MDEIAFGVLESCQEYVSRQREMLPQLAVALGVDQSQVFYTWAIRRGFPQRGKLAGDDWTYFFHGYDCDLRNDTDGRHVGLYFAPKGRVGTVGSWEVLRFIMTSVPPWREFPELRTHFAKNGPPYEENSGDWERFLPVWDRLTDQGLFEQVDSALVELQAKYTTKKPGGMSLLQFPPELSEELRADCAVAHRWQLSQKAIQILNSRLLSAAPRVENQHVSQPTNLINPS